MFRFIVFARRLAAVGTVVTRSSGAGGVGVYEKQLFPRRYLQQLTIMPTVKFKLSVKFSFNLGVVFC